MNYLSRGAWTLAILISLLLLGCSDKSEKLTASLPVKEIVPEPKVAYGIEYDTLEYIAGAIEPHQLLGNLLHEYGVSDRAIYEISLLPDSLFNVKRIRPGDSYALFLHNGALQYLAYEKDPVNYVVLSFLDSIQCSVGSKPVVSTVKSFSAEITSSLWNAFVDAGEDPLMANELSEIYAWSIDFFGLQEGDEFKVIYEEGSVDGERIGIQQIHAAWFAHAGRDYWAIPFVQDSVRSFFDEEGNSLRKAFLKAPLRYSRISSGFSHSRMHPILKYRRPHHGVDYAAPMGTPVYAVGDGTIIAATWQNGGGNYIKIKHNGVYTTAYLHLRNFAKGIKKGVYVRQSDLIGYVGSTGLSTGPHLDFRFYMNGKAIDPLKVEAPPVEPVHEELLTEFNLVKNSWLQALRSIEL